MRILLVTTAAVCVLGFLVTIDRAPLPLTDEVTYASVARSLQLGEGGAPSALRDSPHRVDHVAFYGPVFFSLAAWSARWLGFSMTAFRAVSLTGALLTACAAALLVLAFGERGDRPLWSFTLLLLTPELGHSATGGTMDTLAVGFGILALAVFVRVVLRSRHPRRGGAAAGMLLAFGALTTPRAWPWVGAFVMAGILSPALTLKRTRAVETPLLAAAATVAAMVAAWGTYSHGSPVAYLRDLAWVATHGNDAAGWFPSIERLWFIRPWTVVTSLFAVAGTVVAARSLRRRGAEPGREAVMVTFVLAAGWINLVVGVSVMNATFVFATYFAIPLLAILLSLPRRSVPHVDARVVGLLVAGLVVCGVGIRAAKYAGVATTWAARDPGSIRTFVSDHVPAESEVVGPSEYYLYAVEGAGSRYVFNDAQSPADWARVIQRVDPRLVLPPVPHAAAAARFLIWPSEDPLPDRYACARGSAVASFKPAPPGRLSHWNPAGALGFDGAVPSYPPTSLYRLPAGCPGGDGVQAGW